MTSDIPVILAADNNYAPYIDVLMISILKNAKSNPNFDFYILTPPAFDDKNKKRIEKDCAFYKNININFINMKDDFSDTKKMISHISAQTYYRLKAAEILPDKYKKCIYLDTDTIVEGDLEEFYNIDLEDNYVAGVYAAAYHFSPNNCASHCQKLEIPSINQYINTGVLLINLEKIRKNNMTKELCKEAYKNYPTLDQDVINKVFYNSIKHLPLKYNLMTKYKGLVNKKLSEYEKLCNLYGKDAIEKAVENPYIIHYADKIKPWNKTSVIFAKNWWKYAKYSSFYNKICFSYLKNKFILNPLLFLFSIKKEHSGYTIQILGFKFKSKNKKHNTAIDELQETNSETAKKIYYNLFQNKNNFEDDIDKHFENFVSFRYDYRSTSSKYGVNLGDYIQSIAVKNLIKNLYPDTNIISFDRDNLGNYDNKLAYTVMQGWFSNGFTFLPNKRITPIYIGMHINSIAQKNIFEFLQYNPSYFQNETIGCRDNYTRQYFEKLKIPHYLSRCLTLTMPKRQIKDTQNKIFLVNLSDEIIRKLPEEIRKNALIINQRTVDCDCDKMFYYNCENKYLKKSQNLLDKYKNEAKLIITSALHCACPCVAMGIPVILFKNKNNANRLSVLDGILKQYTYDDLINNKIDFNPPLLDISKLKELIIKNLELTIQLKKGIYVDREKLNSIRKEIEEYNII